MSINVTSTEHHLNTTVSSLAELCVRLGKDTTMPASKLRDMVSALSTLAKVLGRPLEAIPANPVYIREAIAHLTPAMAGLKPGRWRNVQSLVSAALAHVGIVTVQGRIREKPSAEWLSILSHLGAGIGRHFHVWRLARYCTQAGITPEAVNDQVICRYAQDLTAHSLVAEPKRAAREAARSWNAALVAHTAWPQHPLSVPDNRHVFAPDWSAYPESLTAQISVWTNRLTDPRLFNGRPGKPLKTASVDSMRRHLRAYLGALVVGGVPPETLVDLASAVTPERAAIALNYFWDKAQGRATVYTYKHIQLVLMIARHEAKLPLAQIKELEAMVPDLKPAGGRITERNVARLRQLDDPHKMQALLNLPETLLAKAKRLGPPTIRTAHEVQTAAIIELLLHIPMRLKNLRGLRLGIHVRRDQRGLIRITVPGDEVKNGTPIDAQLQQTASDLLASYIDIYRPLLTPDASDHLIPGKCAGTPKSDQGTRCQIQGALADHIGIEFHPHAFRHLAAYLVLRENPEAHGLVQRLLGHNSLHATMTFYSGLEGDAAVQHLDALIARQRQPAPSNRAGKSR